MIHFVFTKVYALVAANPATFSRVMGILNRNPVLFTFVSRLAQPYNPRHVYETLNEKILAPQVTEIYSELLAKTYGGGS